MMLKTLMKYEMIDSHSWEFIHEYTFKDFSGIDVVHYYFKCKICGEWGHTEVSSTNFPVYMGNLITCNEALTKSIIE